jgi:hypothetical protein
VNGIRTGFVEIVRDFLAAHQLMSRLFASFRVGELRFSELEELIGDNDGAILFRLKERCHALFRCEPGGSGGVMRREELFDLAVGSLFHEAMRFRESFYQREVYGTRARALGSEVETEDVALFREFEKILSLVSLRIEEDVQEVEALFLRTREQLRVLLAEHREEGHVVRCLLEQRELVEGVFSEGLDSLLEEMFGDPAEGYLLAGHSYLASGYFGEAERSFAEAAKRGGERGELLRLCSYARGMAAYFVNDYADSVEQLQRWLEAGGSEDAALIDFAHAAVSKIRQLLPPGDRQGVVEAATALLERIGSLRQPPPAEAKS